MDVAALSGFGDDATVIASAKSGDEKAFRELVRRYQDTVYRFAFNVCRDQDKAAETLQNTFINVYRKLDTFDGRSKFSTWLYSIVTNNCLMRRRSDSTRRQELSLDDPLIEAETSSLASDAETVSPMHALLEGELKEVFDNAILKLPVDYRIVFVMRDLEDMPAAEVSKALGISVAAVKSRLFRAREFLRKQLRPYVEDSL
ncbi:MAG: sigma-70 family RNA polymerase sigma factor [Bacteroidetes bacterium]|nr:sigma-70 family RNA polymerase sigma factor [Bacteroidota bacterium]